MTDVLGSCTDCIISMPVVPKLTLDATLKVSLGQNQVIRNVGNFPVRFDATAGSSVEYFNVPASGSITLPSQTSGLIIATTGQLNLTITKTVGMTTTMYEVVVNQLYVADDTLTTVTIANPSTTVAVTGQLMYVPPVPLTS